MNTAHPARAAIGLVVALVLAACSAGAASAPPTGSNEDRPVGDQRPADRLQRGPAGGSFGRPVTEPTNEDPPAARSGAR